MALALALALVLVLALELVVAIRLEQPGAPRPPVTSRWPHELRVIVQEDETHTRRARAIEGHIDVGKQPR